MEDGTFKSHGHCQGTVLPDDVVQWHADEDCEVRQLLERIADKWTMVVVALLADRTTMRFSELRREIDGVSQRMLTVTLRNLERDGMVQRTVYPVVPPKVEYTLTPLGASLYRMAQTLVDWTERHEAQIAAARAAFDERADAVRAAAA